MCGRWRHDLLSFSIASAQISHISNPEILWSEAGFANFEPRRQNGVWSNEIKTADPPGQIKGFYLRISVNEKGSFYALISLLIHNVWIIVLKSETFVFPRFFDHLRRQGDRIPSHCWHSSGTYSELRQWCRWAHDLESLQYLWYEHTITRQLNNDTNVSYKPLLYKQGTYFRVNVQGTIQLD